jgi:KDO2-lipid IV(A) lauroyltransferase
VRCWGMAPLVLVACGIARLPQRVLLGLATVLTVLLWPLLRSRRRIAAINIGLCFPELSADARRRLLRANQRESVMGVLELIRCWYAPSSALAGLARIEGLPLLQEALASGHGVMLLTGHFTSTELAARMLSEAAGKPVIGIVRRNNSRCLEETFEKARSRVGSTLAKKDVRGMLRALQGGGMLAYSADQNFNYQNAFVPFFGVPASTLTSTPDLVRRGRAKVLPFWFHREPDGRYCLYVEEMWPGWLDAGPEEAAATYMRELEAVVRRHPEQYLWVHRRFKTRPPGAPPIY